MSRKLTLLLTGLLVGAGALAHAQAEGPGIKLGERLVLHPGVALQVGHDSNMLYSNEKDSEAAGGGGLLGAVYGPYVTVAPVLDLATENTQRGGPVSHTIDFRLHAGAGARFVLTGDNQFNKDHWGVDVNAGAALQVFPAGAVSFDAFDNFTRTSQPPYYRVLQTSNLNWDRNQLGLRLHWRPGGRRLETMIQYAFGFFGFEGDQASQLFQDKNYIDNDIQLRVSWKFFPKTALYLNGQETIYTFYNRQLSTPANSYPLRLVLGVVGLITPKLTIDLNAGYANGFYDYSSLSTPTKVQPNPNTFVASLSLSWKPTFMTGISLGYSHNFAVSTVGMYYDLDSITVGLSQLIWRIIGTLTAGWTERRFQGDLTVDGQMNAPGGGASRTDDLLVLHLDFQYRIRPWFVVSIGDDMQFNFSNCALLAPMSAVSIPCDYKRNDGWIKLLVQY